MCRRCRKVDFKMILPVSDNYDESRDTAYLEINGTLPLCNPRDLLQCDLLEGLEEDE